MSILRTIRPRGVRMCARFGHLSPTVHQRPGFEAYDRHDREFLCYWCRRCNGIIEVATRSDIDNPRGAL